MASDLNKVLSKETDVGLQVWELIGIIVGLLIVVILLALTFYLTLRKKSRRPKDNLPLCQIPTVSKEIKEVRVANGSTNEFSSHNGILLTIQDNSSNKDSDKVLVHLGVGRTKNGVGNIYNDSLSGSFHLPEKDFCGSHSGEEGSSGKFSGYKPYSSRPIAAPSPLSGLPEFSHLGWGHWFTLRDLELATNRFSKENVLGEGGYGVVYHGQLINGTEVAIKKLLNNLCVPFAHFFICISVAEISPLLVTDPLFSFSYSNMDTLLLLVIYNHLPDDKWLRGPVVTRNTLSCIKSGKNESR